MHKNFFLLIYFILISACSLPGTALLGPTFTGVKTGSIYQTSLSYGSSQAVNAFKNSLNNRQLDVEMIKEEDKEKNVESKRIKDPPILVSLKTYDVEFLDNIDEEPLP